MKGFFISMDAAMAVIVVLIFSMTALLVLNSSHDDGVVYLSRLARDYYEVKRIDPSADLSWINTSCDNAPVVVSKKAYYYDSEANEVKAELVKVCGVYG